MWSHTAAHGEAAADFDTSPARSWRDTLLPPRRRDAPAEVDTGCAEVALENAPKWQ
jgi:hypothetical protein